MERKQENYFTAKMMRRQLVPSLISALGLAFGDIVDALVVGRQMGVTGLAAISLTLPVFMVINVVMHGFGIGGSVRYAMLLAKGKKKEAVEKFQGILLTAGLLGIGLALAGNLFLPQILSLLGTVPEDGILYEAAGTYAGIILGGIPLFFLAYISNYYLRNDDCQRLAGVGFTIGNLSDIGLNFLLVWGLDLGVAGAAWATLAGQAVSIGCYLTVYWKKNRCLRLFPFTPRFQTCFSSFRAGFASSSQYLYSMLFLLTANRVLMEKTGSLGPAVLDLVQNASFFLLYLYEGTARAAQPVISTYTGEKDEEGRRRVRKNALFFGSLTGLCGILLVAFFPRQVCALFGMKEAGEAGVYALQVYCTGAGIAGINLLLESYEQACGREKGAFVMTTLRGAAVLLPVTAFFSFFPLEGFWWLFPVTEVISLFLFLIWKKNRGKEQALVTDPERVLRRTFGSSREELSRFLTETEVFCERWGASWKQSYFVNLTVEELCAVIMEKGFKKEKGYIQVTLISEPDGDFQLYIRDGAIAFNPFSLEGKKLKAGEQADGTEVDAMGVLIVRQKAKEFFYRRYQGFNTLIVRI